MTLTGLSKYKKMGDESEMTYHLFKGNFLSSTGEDSVAYTAYIPEGEIRAILQISHGMAEHFARYEGFSIFLAERGILVCGNDHLGHGETASSLENLGYFSKEKGWIHMVDDMHLLMLIMKEDYQETPYFIMGHSMGSLLTRAFLTTYGRELSGVILMGTSGKNNLTKAAMPIVNAVGALKGERHRSGLIHALAFGNYTKRYEKGSDRLAWMSQDPTILSAFRSDPKCNFVLTVAGFRDLMTVLSFVSRKKWAEEVPKNLPMYLVSGDMDPVGNYGKGVRQVYKNLLTAKGKDLSMKLYPGVRHELLNEPSKEIVSNDILGWLENHL